MSEEAALHPERIRSALKAIEVLKKYNDPGLSDEELETCQAALILVRKGQLAVGLTGEIADAGRAGLQLLQAIQKLTGGK